MLPDLVLNELSVDAFVGFKFPQKGTFRCRLVLRLRHKSFKMNTREWTWTKCDRKF